MTFNLKQVSWPLLNLSSGLSRRGHQTTRIESPGKISFNQVIPTIHWAPAVWHTLYKYYLIGLTVGIKYYHPDVINEPTDFQESLVTFPTFLTLVIDELRFDWIWSLCSFLHATKSCSYRVARNLEAALELPSFFSSSKQYENINKNDRREYVLDLEDIEETGNQIHGPQGLAI